MSSINFIEKITNFFIEGRHDQIIKLLDQEAFRLKKAGKLHASKKIKNIIKKIPSNSNIFFAESNEKNALGVNISDYQDNALVKRSFPNVSPEQVVLNTETKAKIEDFFRQWEDFEILSRHNLFPTNKILLYGPPGTGKTLLANAIAQKLDRPLILIQLDELISSFLGETGKNIKRIFKIAAQEQVVLFLDEIDTIAKFRSDERELGELKRIVTVLLQHVDEFSNNSIIIGATNHDEILDKAIWRRFPLKLRLDLPDKESRKLLFKLYLDSIECFVNLELLSDLTNGFNGSLIYNISQDAKKLAVLSGANKITNRIVVKAILDSSDGFNLRDHHVKADAYALCKRLKKSGFTLKEIESIAGIPYTTLRDNVK